MTTQPQPRPGGEPVTPAAREMVEHPSHYGGDVDHETWKCLAAWGMTGNVYRWNAIKYLARAGRKGGKQEELDDLFKAIWYVTRDIQVQEGLAANPQAAPHE